MIFITGDTHSDFTPRLSKRFFPATAEDYLIICGDFGGVWDDSNKEKYWLKWLSERPFTTLFVSGNHENFDMLAELPVSEWNGGKVQFVRNNIIHLMRSQIFNIEGSTFFTMGGGASHDIDGGILEPDDPDFKEKANRLNKQMALYRVNHVSWWKEEMPSDEEYAEANKNLDIHNRTVDYIITHSAPTSAAYVIGRGLYKPDALTDYLETVKQTCIFKRWFFGHYHENQMIEKNILLLYENVICFDKMMLAQNYFKKYRK